MYGAGGTGAILPQEMVNRRDKSARFARWGVYFANKPPVQSWKAALKSVVNRGYANVTFHQVSRYKVELVWATAVTVASPIRLCKKAMKFTPLMEVCGDPVGVVDEGPAVVHEDPPAKRPRPRLKKKTQVLDDYLVNATGEAADEEGVAADALAASATPLLPSCLLSLKCENLVHRAYCEGEIPKHDYEVNIQAPWFFPEGNFGKVYPGTAGVGPTSRPVAIKLFFTPDVCPVFCEAAAEEAMAEVRRHVALLPSNPRLVKLLDVQLFSGRTQAESARVGLIFESFDTDLCTFLKTRGLTAPGKRHVLRSVSEALVYLHDSGVVHTQLQSSKVVLSGAAVRPAVLDQEPDSDAPLDITYQLPSSFEVSLIPHQGAPCWKYGLDTQILPRGGGGCARQGGTVMFTRPRNH